MFGEKKQADKIADKYVAFPSEILTNIEKRIIINKKGSVLGFKKFKSTARYG